MTPDGAQKQLRAQKKDARRGVARCQKQDGSVQGLGDEIFATAG
jgi:hypothetical protein